MRKLALVICLIVAGCGASNPELSPVEKAKRWTQAETQQNVNYCVEEPSGEGFRTFVCDYGDSDRNSDGADDYTWCLVDVSEDGITNGQCPFLKKERTAAA